MKKSVFFKLKSLFKSDKNNFVIKDKQYELIIRDSIYEWGLFCENELIPFEYITIGLDNIKVMRGKDLIEMNLSPDQVKFIEAFDLDNPRGV